MQKVNNKLSLARRGETWDVRLMMRLIGLKRRLRGDLWLKRRLRGRLWLNEELGLLRGSETSRKNRVWSTTLVGRSGANKQLTWGLLSLNGLEEV